MRLTERMRRNLGTERSVIPTGPVYCAGKYVVRYEGRVVEDAQGKWLTFDSLREAQSYYDKLKGETK
jgi:hypothetical protein